MSGHLEFYDIHKAFHTRPLLDIKTFSLQPGHCIALTGHNGAGKTTLLKILAGLEAPQHARVSYRGAPTLPWQQLRQTLRHEVVYLHQFPYMFDATVMKNVAYGLARQHVPQPHRHRLVREALRQVGLEHLIEADAKKLSGGERQRVALARALVLEPQLLLLDEPTASMDREGREQIIPLLQQLKERGLTCVIVSHDVSTLGNLPNSYLKLEGGKLTPLIESHSSASSRSRQTDSTLHVMAEPLWGGGHV